MRARVIARKKGYAIRILSPRNMEAEEVRDLSHALRELPCVLRAIVRGQEIFLKTRQRGKKIRRQLEIVANSVLRCFVSTPSHKRRRKPAFSRARPQAPKVTEAY